MSEAQRIIQHYKKINKCVKKIKFCIHKIDNYNCIVCRPHLACEHKKLKRNCKTCKNLKKTIDKTCKNLKKPIDKRCKNLKKPIDKTCVYCDNVITFNETSCNICNILYDDHQDSEFCDVQNEHSLKLLIYL